MRTSTTQPPLGTPLNRNHSLSKGMVGCWLLNEGGGTIARDSTRLNGIDGVLTNGPVSQKTARGNAVLFDGVNDFITIANTSNIALTTDITVSVWVNIISFIHAVNQVMLKNNANTGFYGFYVSSAGNVVFQVTGANHTSATVLALGVWYHVCCVKNINLTNNMSIFINGAKEVFAGSGTVINTSTAALNFGTDSVNAGRQANMLLQDVKVYNRPLSDTEVRQLYTNPYSMFIGKVR